MSSRYAIHPLEQKFRDDMIAQAKRDEYIKDIIDECEELDITDPKRMARRAFIMGQYYESQLQQAKTGVKVEPTRTYEEWLDTKVGAVVEGAEVCIRHYIGPDQHMIAKLVYETLMKELAK